MWDRYLCSSMAVQHGNKLGKMDNPPIYTPQYRAGRRAIELEKLKINGILTMDVIEHAQMEWATSIVSIHKKDGAISFCVAYKSYIQ